tara:strand:+ start:8801 stop:10891 length:2091 start_codon:yes stop_codon:yes gene_type:complete
MNIIKNIFKKTKKEKIDEIEEIRRLIKEKNDKIFKIINKLNINESLIIAACYLDPLDYENSMLNKIIKNKKINIEKKINEIKKLINKNPRYLSIELGTEIERYPYKKDSFKEDIENIFKQLLIKKRINKESIDVVFKDEKKIFFNIKGLIPKNIKIINNKLELTISNQTIDFKEIYVNIEVKKIRFFNCKIINFDNKNKNNHLKIEEIKIEYSELNNIKSEIITGMNFLEINKKTKIENSELTISKEYSDDEEEFKKIILKELEINDSKIELNYPTHKYNNEISNKSLYYVTEDFKFENIKMKKSLIKIPCLIKLKKDVKVKNIIMDEYSEIDFRFKQNKTYILKVEEEIKNIPKLEKDENNLFIEDSKIEGTLNFSSVEFLCNIRKIKIHNIDSKNGFIINLEHARINNNLEIEYSNIKELNIKNISLNSRLKINNSKIKNIKIEELNTNKDIINKKELLIENSTIIENLNLSNRLKNMSNVSFKNTTFEKGLLITNNKFNFVPDLTNTSYNNEISLHNLKVKIKNKKEDKDKIRKLKAIAEENKDVDSILEYNALELITKKTNFINSLVINFYFIVSNFGKSIFLPFFWWFGSNILFSYYYYRLLNISECICHQEVYISQVIKFSFLNSVSFGQILRNPNKMFFEYFYNKPEGSFNLLVDMPWHHMLAIKFHILLSAVFIFLMLLGVRNRFRIK